ncbi:ABC-type uncharacterized transport system periplasmic component-like protein [Candidatus Moduliflexus flocculans]|uniref:ABC-type uncharacterized transport system periplasmic component-like protein n=1 Tax=Candidatus Moduliflexus flocculans TaxID=1499966 RepID=A0A0S6VZY6_9BACT|nr:ABC-type uncharacterized transport system periplasmic component-like protein [Candidatus Moduliflexus flocculans]
MSGKMRYVLAGFAVGIVVMAGLAAVASACNVLVVMSYDDTYPWEQEVRDGIESVLNGRCELTYSYMDTNRYSDVGPQKAEEAYNLYQQLQPDGVIAVDDNAQSMFVVPYLKDKTQTPVMFCGVNAEPDVYGYPASNVSGMLERLHIFETVLFAQQLVPNLKTFAIVQKNSSTAEMLVQQIEQEQETYPAKLIGHYRPTALAEALKIAAELKTQADVLFYETFDKISDENGQLLTDAEVVPMIAAAFGKPLIGNNAYHIRDGVLCAVIKLGEEQGSVAAQKLLQVLGGTPVSDIPIERNKKGKRIINVTALRRFGLKPKPIALQGAELIETGK